MKIQHYLNYNKSRNLCIPAPEIISHTFQIFKIYIHTHTCDGFWLVKQESPLLTSFTNIFSSLENDSGLWRQQLTCNAYCKRGTISYSLQGLASFIISIQCKYRHTHAHMYTVIQCQQNIIYIYIYIIGIKYRWKFNRMIG